MKLSIRAQEWAVLPDRHRRLLKLDRRSHDLAGSHTPICYADHTAETLAFNYNRLDELMGMTGPVSENYAYDQTGATTYDIGNLKTKNLGAYTYPGTKSPSGTVAHAPASISGVGSYGYDANGSRTADPSYSAFIYDQENRLTSLGSPVALTNTYDGAGSRVIRVASGTTTHFVGDLYTVNPTTSVPSVYYMFNGMVIAVKTGTPVTLNYLHHDQLGSLVSATNAAGTAEVGSARYLPYGALRDVASTGTNPAGLLPLTDRLFTGQIRDLPSDAYYFFKARYYDATIGKFQAADMVGPKPANPRTLNRYAYALNNPIRLIDPTGHGSWDPNWGAAFQAAHNGQAPTQQDWNDYQFSLSHSGSGANGTWTSADWQDCHDAGYLLDRTFYVTGNFQLYQPSDTTGINGDAFGHPVWSTGGSLATLAGVDFATSYVRVHERVTGAGTHIDLFVGVSAGDPRTTLRPTYSLWFSVPPENPGPPARGQLARYVGAAVRSTADPRFSYAGEFDIPASSGNVFRLALTVNPWAPGAFLLTGTTSFEFDL